MQYLGIAFFCNKKNIFLLFKNQRLSITVSIKVTNK